MLGRKLTPGLPSETFLAVYLFLESSSISLQTGQTGKLCAHIHDPPLKQTMVFVDEVA